MPNTLLGLLEQERPVDKTIDHKTIQRNCAELQKRQAPPVTVLKQLENRERHLTVKLGNQRTLDEHSRKANLYRERLNELKGLRTDLETKKTFAEKEQAIDSRTRAAIAARINESLAEVETHEKEATRWLKVHEAGIAESEKLLITEDEKKELAQIRKRLNDITLVSSIANPSTKMGSVRPMSNVNSGELGSQSLVGNRRG